MAYKNNVFINCPFDTQYRDFIERLLFVLHSLGFNALISINKSSGHDRILEITKMIKNSKYSIHDLSRNTAKKKGEYARQNMPFEFGIDFGCFTYLKNKSDKLIAILDGNPHAYDNYLSDMSGRDILCHKNDPNLIFTVIPEWLSRNTEIVYQAPKVLSKKFSNWKIAYKDALKNRGYDLRAIKSVDINIYQLTLKKWLSENSQ